MSNEYQAYFLVNNFDADGRPIIDGIIPLNAYFTDPVPLVLHEIIAQGAEEKVCRKYSI